MTPRVFLDTNIVLDLLLERSGYARCAEILQYHENREIRAFLSTLSLANIAYVLRKLFPPQLLFPSILQIIPVIEVLPLKKEHFQDACLMEGRDFEDTLQAICAIDGQCDIIVTRNKKDFQILKGMKSDCRHIPQVMTPEEFLSSIQTETP